MPSNLGPKDTLNKLKQSQNAVRRALRDFHSSIRRPAVRRALSKEFISFVGIILMYKCNFNFCLLMLMITNI